MTLAGAVCVFAQDKSFSLTREDYPAVGGSTSAQPLGVLIAGRVTRTSVEWRELSTFDPTLRLVLTETPYDPAAKLVLGGPRPPRGATDLRSALSASLARLSDRTTHTGTNESFARLASRQIELAIVAREPTAEERAQVKRAGADLVVQPIARDAFVFLKHSSNQVKGLTLAQVRDIYAGALTNWKDAGGADVTINAYQRDAASGSQVEMENLMKGRKMIDGLDIRMTALMFGPFNAIRSDRAGIGYSYHYYERFMVALPEVTTLAIDGVVAEPATIANGKYPLSTFVYLAHRSDLPRSSPAARLRDWLRTPAGQAVVAESGYVPLK
jgi:phosphate transport system substrate-binding protein